MDNLTDEQIEKAVNWWSKQLQAPHFDNGDDSEVGGMCSVLASVAYKQPTESALGVFRAELRKRLKLDPSVWLNVDYEPCPVLEESAEIAKISHTAFPWKTSMFFEDGKTLVSAGYRAALTEV